MGRSKNGFDILNTYRLATNRAAITTVTEDCA
jgi:hypothetical protein